MHRFRNSGVITASSGLLILLAVYLLFVPFQWIAAWLIASAVHELGHYIALRLCKVNVLSLHIDVAGAQIHTEPMIPVFEAVSAISGPMGGLLLLLFLRYCPRIAICGMIQSAFNLLPIYPWDGGRVYRIVMGMFFSEALTEQVCCWTEKVILVILFACAYILAVRFGLGVIPFVVWMIILLKSGKIKIPCKQRELIVQ